MTKSAPSERATRTGTGLDQAAIHIFVTIDGNRLEQAGHALEARTAMPVLPVRNTISSPLCRSVATTAKSLVEFFQRTLLHRIIDEILQLPRP